MSFQNANNQFREQNRRNSNVKKNSFDRYSLKNNKPTSTTSSNIQIHDNNENLIKKSQKLLQSSKQKRQIPHDKLKLMQQVFTNINGSQTIPADRLTDALIGLGYDPRNDINYQEFLIEHDLIEANGKFAGLLDFEHYALVVFAYDEKLNLEEEAVRRLDLKIAFESFDLNKDGMIDANDLLVFLNTLGFTITDREAKAMIDFADHDKDSLLSFDEFLIVLTQISTLNTSKMQMQ